MGRHGAPEIFNTDQGSQVTSDSIIAACRRPSWRSKVPMDGKENLEG